MKAHAIVLVVYASILCLVACRKSESTARCSTPESSHVEGPRTMCVDYWREQEEDSIGFEMGASWSEFSSEDSVDNRVRAISNPVAHELKDVVIKHLFSFFDIDEIRTFEVQDSDFKSEGHFHYVVFDSADFEYRYYQIPDTNVNVRVWTMRFIDLHKESETANK